VDLLTYVLPGIVILAGLIIFFGSFFTVRSQTVVLIERFGKFSRVANAGLNFKLPIMETARTLSLATFQLDGKIETKTKDNVFVALPVSIQYRVIDHPEAIRSAFYKLVNPKQQIESYLYNILLSHIPETDLDDVFTSQPAIAKRATDELSSEMKDFGYEIVKVLITDVVVDDSVAKAMNRINAEQRNKVANQAQGEAEYVLKVKQAEADAEVRRLQGVGIAQERQAIADGWSKAITDLGQGGHMTDKEAAFLLMFTNYTDMMSRVGESKNTTMVFMPSGPQSITDFQQALTNAQLAMEK